MSAWKSNILEFNSRKQFGGHASVPLPFERNRRETSNFGGLHRSITYFLLGQNCIS